MLRLLALSTTALVALSLQAAANPIVNNAPGAVINILEGETVDENGVAVNLGGELATLNNEGDIISRNNDAVTARGDFFTLNNRGTGLIEAGGKGVEIDGLSPEVYNDGAIIADGDAVEANVDFLFLVNTGEIVSTESRGVQTRGFGAAIENFGIIDAFDEAVEGRDGFSLVNEGVISSTSSDGVQFGEGVLVNDGVIIGSVDADAGDGDGDGVDIDSGSIVNYGVITTNGAGGGVDVDAEGEDGNPAPTLSIQNFGEISGLVGVQYDEASTADAEIYNAGLIEGFGGVAMQFAPGQGAIDLLLADGSTVIGDIVFGASDDFLTLSSLSNGGDMLSGGVAFGGDGFDSLIADMDLIGDLVRRGDFYTAMFLTGFGDEGSVTFTQFESVSFGTAFFDADDLAGIAPVPLPAAGWLLLAGLGGLAALCRRG